MIRTNQHFPSLNIQTTNFFTCLNARIRIPNGYNAIRWNVTEIVVMFFPYCLKLCKRLVHEVLKRIKNGYGRSLLHRWNGIGNIECKTIILVRMEIFLIK